MNKMQTRLPSYNATSNTNFPEDVTQVYSYESLEDYEEQDSTKHRNFCPEVNRKLIIYKAFYFLFFGAVGALFPYLVVFYKQLWLSAHQVGILIGLRPFIQMCASPLWGVLADTYNVSKWILLMSIGAWLVSNFSISLVKPREYETGCDLNLTYLPLSDYMDEEEFHWPRIEGLISKKDNLTKPGFAVDYYNGSDIENKKEMNTMSKGENEETSSLFATEKSHNNPLSSRYDGGRGQNNNNNWMGKNRNHGVDRNASTNIKILRIMFNPFLTSLKSKTKTKTRRSIPKMHVAKRSQQNPERVSKKEKFRHLVYLLHRQLNTSTDENERKASELFSKLRAIFKKRRNIRRATREKSLDDSTENDLESEEYLQDITDSNGGFYEDSLLPNQRVLETEELKEEFDSIKPPGEFFLPLDDDMDASNSSEASNPARTEEARSLFHVLLVITICGTILSSPAATLADTATLQALGDDKYRYGQQRLWGSFGWGLGAFIVGTVVSLMQEIHQCADPKHIDYILSFYVYALVMGLAFACALFIRYEPIDETRYTESFWEAIKMFTDCQHICFILTLLCSGTAIGFTHTFLFWHLHDMGGSQFLFSIIAAVQCISEVFMYLISGYLILKIGCDNVLYIGLLANVLRLFAYSVITKPLYSVPLEVLQGVSSASIWTAAICYVGLSPGVQVTLQAMLHGIYWGLGHGGGGMLGGLIVSYLGSNATFIIFGIVCVINLVTLFLMRYWSKFLELLGNYTYAENIPAGTYILVENKTAGKRKEN